MDKRKIDALVAEHVMQLAVKPDSDVEGEWECMTRRGVDRVKEYSIDIAKAWEVVEKMTDDRWFFDLNVHRGECKATFWGSGYDNRSVAMGEPPLAICLAALKAKGVEIPT